MGQQRTFEESLLDVIGIARDELRHLRLLDVGVSARRITLNAARLPHLEVGAFGGISVGGWSCVDGQGHCEDGEHFGELHGCGVLIEAALELLFGLLSWAGEGYR